VNLTIIRGSLPDQVYDLLRGEAGTSVKVITYTSVTKLVIAAELLIFSLPFSRLLSMLDFFRSDKAT
jgi:hypothetical protein